MPRRLCPLGREQPKKIVEIYYQFHYYRFMDFSKIKKGLALLMAVFLLSSCGSNLFETLDTTSVAESFDELLGDASSVEEYSEIVDAANDIISSNTSTDQEKKDAYYAKSEALLGENEISTLDLFTDLAGASEEGSSGNIIALFDLETDNDVLLEAAASISSAEGLVTSNSASLDQQLIKGVVNTMIIINTTKEVFDIGDDGEIEAKDDPDFTWEDSLEDFVFPNGTDEDDISEYSGSATEGFLHSGALNDDQNGELDKIDDAMDDIVSLQDKVSNEGIFEFGDETYHFSGVSDATKEQNIEDALNAIFGSMGAD